MDKGEVCRKAAEIVDGPRADAYGDVMDMHQRIADYWPMYMQRPIRAIDVAHMMILLKLARAEVCPQHADNYIDIAGYAGCASEVSTYEQPTLPLSTRDNAL